MDSGKYYQVPQLAVSHNFFKICNRSGYIRKLPKNQKASDEARQYAAELGLSLPEGKTFVRAHEFHVYRKICSK